MINSMSVAGVEGENTAITFNELGIGYISASQSTILKVDKIRHDAITSFLQFVCLFFFFLFLFFFVFCFFNLLHGEDNPGPVMRLFSGQHNHEHN